jgi:hypothetical protein
MMKGMLMTAEQEHQILREVRDVRAALEAHVEQQSVEFSEMSVSVKQISDSLGPILEERRDMTGAMRIGNIIGKMIIGIAAAATTIVGAYFALRAAFRG